MSSRHYKLSELSALFIFNPQEDKGREDLEADKIICFVPPSLSLDEQKNYVGLAEGLVAFTKEYNPNSPVHSVHCQKHRYAFYEAEPNFWIVMVISNRNLIRGENKDEIPLEAEHDDDVLQTILHQIYDYFYLFNGSMADIMKKHSTSILRERLSQYIEYIVTCIKFPHLIQYIDILGFDYFPIDRSSFLLVQYIMNNIQSKYPEIISTALMHKTKVIWNSIGQQDMLLLQNLQKGDYRSFYTYFCLNTEPENELKTEVPTKNNEQMNDLTNLLKRGLSYQKSYIGQFLTGPLRRGKHTDFAPVLYLKSRPGQISRLVTYQYHNVALYLILDGSSNSHRSIDFYQRLEQAISEDLKKLDEKILKQASRKDETLRYLFFNKMNLALTSALFNPHIDLIKVIRNIHSDFNKSGPTSASEICVKTRQDGWVIGRKSSDTHREYYILLDEKAGDLVQVSEQADLLASQHFDVFLQNLNNFNN